MVTKVGQLSAVHSEIYGCTLCGLCTGRTRTVPGAGNPDAEIMFIGEAPGEHEDLQGLPFVGKSGQYLDELLARNGLSRDAVFIANVVKCRPLKNRDPLPEEIAACNAYLTRQIEINDPLVIATL
jgi:uracil-DNA glycosylase family 4